MKNRRTIVMAFLLCACLIVGMGYAAVTDVLTIGGTATISYENAAEDFNADVYFVEATDTKVYGVSGNTKVEIGTVTVTADNDVVDVKINNVAGDGEFAVYGDKATFTVKIANVGTADATIAFDAAGAATEYFTFEVTDGKVTAGGTTEFTIEVTIAKTPDYTADADFSASFTLKATATAVDPQA
jgi:hypothetical protein